MLLPAQLHREAMCLPPPVPPACTCPLSRWREKYKAGRKGARGRGRLRWSSEWPANPCQHPGSNKQMCPLHLGTEEEKGHTGAALGGPRRPLSRTRPSLCAGAGMGVSKESNVPHQEGGGGRDGGHRPVGVPVMLILGHGTISLFASFVRAARVAALFNSLRHV